MADDPFGMADQLAETFGQIGRLLADGLLTLPSFNIQFDGPPLQDVDFEQGKYNYSKEEPCEMTPDQVESQAGGKIKVSATALSSKDLANDFFDQQTRASVKGGTGPAKRCDTGCFWLRVSVRLEGCQSSFCLVLMMNTEGFHKPWYVGSPDGIGGHGNSVIVTSTDGQRRLRVLRADGGQNRFRLELL
ncbi:unnamed protein product [Symbiodinium sp. CCMP2592]|nr:unnamed protein product [Symbiodinium sp. CCMP2592]